MYLTLHFSAFHLLLFSLTWSTLDFFMQPFSQPSLSLCWKMQYLQWKLPPPCCFWVPWHTLNNTHPTTLPTDGLFMARTIYFISFTLISIRSPHPKEKFWNRNCPQTPPQWPKEQKSLTGWSGLLLAWFAFVPQSSLSVWFSWQICFSLVFQESEVFVLCSLTGFSLSALFLCLIYL